MKSKIGSMPIAQIPVSLLQKLLAHKIYWLSPMSTLMLLGTPAVLEPSDEGTALAHSHLRRVDGKHLGVHRK